MWVYEQATGRLSREGQPVAIGYSGFGPGKNNPDMEHVHDVGPIPQGWWSIVAVKDSATEGPVTIFLEPWPGTKTYGRSGFRIHGDSKEHACCASHGCIIEPKAGRKKVEEFPEPLLVLARAPYYWEHVPVIDPELGL